MSAMKNRKIKGPSLQRERIFVWVFRSNSLYVMLGVRRMPFGPAHEVLGQRRLISPVVKSSLQVFNRVLVRSHYVLPPRKLEPRFEGRNGIVWYYKPHLTLQTSGVPR